jgi:hypothetical protein
MRFTIASKIKDMTSPNKAAGSRQAHKDKYPVFKRKIQPFVSEIINPNAALVLCLMISLLQQ